MKTHTRAAAVCSTAVGILLAAGGAPAVAESCDYDVTCDSDLECTVCWETPGGVECDTEDWAVLTLILPACLGLPDIPPKPQEAELMIMVTPVITAPSVPRLPDMSRQNGLVTAPTPPGPAAPIPSDAVPGGY